MTAFDLANWLAIILAWSTILSQLPKIEKHSLALMLFVIGLLVPFALVAKLSVLINLGTMLSALILLTSRKRSNSFQRKLSTPLNAIGIGFLAALFFLPLLLKESQGWLILLGLASKYWFLFSMAILYSANTNSYRAKASIAVITLLAGLLWNFKIAFAFFAFVAIEYIITNRSIKGLIAIVLGVAVLSAVTYFWFLDAFLNFLERSVLRPEYDYDTKILGLSDGARLMIWSHYLENSIWFGRGQYYLPETVPPHNIIVHLAHELGILGALIIGPFFFWFVGVVALRVGAITSLLFLLSLSLSSVGEYPSMWVYSVVLAPIVLQSSLFHKRVVVFRDSRYG